MKIESFVLTYYKQHCSPQPLHVPIMPAANQSVMEAIRDEAIAIATKAQAEGNKSLLKALATIPTEFPELTKEIERLDAEILKVQSDRLKRPDCMPDMKKAVSFVKRMSNTHITDLISECDKDAAALLALLEVSREVDDGRYAEQIGGILSDMVVGYNATERLAELEAERRGLISFAEGMQESLVQCIGRAHAPHLVGAAEKAKFGL